ncbi:MAG: LamG domain-containing protein [Chloroflexi bacterium]|nr:LamG domain-containing protein [Chloroflexota bacterium]
MNLVGYTDRLTAAPGDTVRFMVSSQHPRYRADLVQLIHGDESPAGPGYKEREVPSAINGHYPGRSKPIHSGSYVHIPTHPALDTLTSFSVTAWIYPTTPARGLQGLVTRWTDDPAPHGFALVIGPNGDLALHLADGRNSPVHIATGAPLTERVWTFVGASYHAPTGRVSLIQQPLHRWPIAPDQTLVTHDTAATNVCGPSGAPLRFAALTAGPPERTGPIAAPYNGKLDSPRLYNRAFSPDQLSALADPNANQFVADPLAAWDFSLDIGDYRITDTGPHRLHGQAVNMPTRGMTGHNFTGAQTSFRLAPHEYGAIYFHDDDVEDVAWESDFQLTIPPDLPSGVYAARLRAGDDEDHLPFCVRPPRGTATSRIAVLMPTLTYVVYANFRDIDGAFVDHERVPNADPSLHEAVFAYIRANGIPGLYERHSDGSGTTHVSHLRPILNMRPKFRYRVWAAPSRFPADLYLIDWLEAAGHQFDVITDHDLHAEGADLLAPYSVVLTGSHPEYWTTEMLTGMRSYLDRGGRLMYLGGNGFFGVTTIDAERPHIAEVRRWGTSWPFEMPPAERVHSTTGEPGGIWRNRGVAPNGLIGVGSSAAGFDRGSHYVRQPDSFDPRAAFVFDGIGDDEPIGDVPSLVVRHGAAGYEMDRLDFSLGTPPHALLLASSVGHSERYTAFNDERLDFTQGKDGMLPDSPPPSDGPHAFVRADMVYFETPNGGGVFSVGSIAWRGCLSHNNYDNIVSRVTGNVLRRFAADQ